MLTMQDTERFPWKFTEMGLSAVQSTQLNFSLNFQVRKSGVVDQ